MKLSPSRQLVALALLLFSALAAPVAMLVVACAMPCCGTAPSLPPVEAAAGGCNGACGMTGAAPADTQPDAVITSGERLRAPASTIVSIAADPPPRPDAALSHSRRAKHANGPAGRAPLYLRISLLLI